MKTKKLEKLLSMAANENDFDEAYALIMKAMRIDIENGENPGWLVVLPNIKKVKNILDEFNIKVNHEIGFWLLVDFENHDEAFYKLEDDGLVPLCDHYLTYHWFNKISK